MGIGGAQRTIQTGLLTFSRYGVEEAGCGVESQRHGQRSNFLRLTPSAIIRAESSVHKIYFDKDTECFEVISFFLGPVYSNSLAIHPAISRRRSSVVSAECSEGS